MAPATTLHMPELATFLNRHSYGIFTPPLTNVEWQLAKEIKAWAERAKASGKIRLFGFSTHNIMEKCLIAGAKLGWIDGIMLSYNFRIMHNDLMKKAVDNCAVNEWSLRWSRKAEKREPCASPSRPPIPPTTCCPRT